MKVLLILLFWTEFGQNSFAGCIRFFNREKCNMLEADDKQLYEYIRTVKDEVIILHKPTVVPEYTERKVQNNFGTGNQ